MALSITPAPTTNLQTVYSYLPRDSYRWAAAVLVGVILVYAACLAVYRLVFSPIARFPGPKIAALTGWYEFYYDFFQRGKYLFEIEKMHEKYGKQRKFDF